MTKRLLFIALFASIFTLQAQQQSKTASVEQSIYGIQTGLLGIWIHNETKLSNSIALRSEIGLDSGIFGGSAYDDYVNFLMAPVITLEPRWYYNLDKRISKGKSIEKNSGNFVGLKISYHPDWFVISNNEYVNVVNQIDFIPKWAIKRTIGQHFTYELGAGLGYGYIFYDSEYLEDEGEVALDLHLRIGYTF